MHNGIYVLWLLVAHSSASTSGGCGVGVVSVGVGVVSVGVGVVGVGVC